MLKVTNLQVTNVHVVDVEIRVKPCRLMLVKLLHALHWVTGKDRYSRLACKQAIKAVQVRARPGEEWT